MVKKSMGNKDDFDRELEEINESFDYDNYEDGLGFVENMFQAHFTKIDFALRLTQMALANSAKKDTGEEHVFEVYRRALKVINDTSPIEETLRQFGMMSEPQ